MLKHGFNGLKPGQADHTYLKWLFWELSRDCVCDTGVLVWNILQGTCSTEAWPYSASQRQHHPHPSPTLAASSSQFLLLSRRPCVSSSPFPKLLLQAHPSTPSPPGAPASSPPCLLLPPSASPCLPEFAPLPRRESKCLSQIFKVAPSSDNC